MQTTINFSPLKQAMLIAMIGSISLVSGCATTTGGSVENQTYMLDFRCTPIGNTDIVTITASGSSPTSLDFYIQRRGQAVGEFYTSNSFSMSGGTSKEATYTMYNAKEDKFKCQPI